MKKQQTSYSATFWKTKEISKSRPGELQEPKKDINVYEFCNKRGKEENRCTHTMAEKNPYDNSTSEQNTFSEGKQQRFKEVSATSNVKATIQIYKEYEKIKETYHPKKK